MTSDYGIFIENEFGDTKRHLNGIKLINLAISENSKKTELLILLKEAKILFRDSKPSDLGNNWNSVDHGSMPPIFWKIDSFENVIHLIAELSDYAGF